MTAPSDPPLSDSPPGVPRSPRPLRALGFIASGLTVLAVAMLAMTTLLVLAQVALRNLLDLGLPWADELARFGCVALVFLALPRLLIEGKHIAVDLLPNALPVWGRRLMGRLSALLTFGFCALVLWALWLFLRRAAAFSTPALGMPNLVYYTPAIIGVLFLAVAALWRMLAAPESPSMLARELQQDGEQTS